MVNHELRALDVGACSQSFMQMQIGKSLPFVWNTDIPVAESRKVNQLVSLESFWKNLDREQQTKVRQVMGLCKMDPHVGKIRLSYDEKNW